jgi:hypothetical protein
VAADHCVPEDVEVLERSRRLEYGAEPRLRSAVRGPVGDLVTRHHDAAGVGSEETRDAPEERRLPRAVGADQARQRTVLDCEADVVDRCDRTERLRDAADLASEVRGVSPVLRMFGYFWNAFPNSALGLHWTILPAHMESIWTPLWLRGPK